MRSVKIADLKNRLTQYLREVRKGQEIVVCDRNRPIAKIVPLVLDEDADRAALVAEGLLRPGQVYRTRFPGHTFMLCRLA